VTSRTDRRLILLEFYLKPFRAGGRQTSAFEADRCCSFTISLNWHAVLMAAQCANRGPTLRLSAMPERLHPPANAKEKISGPSRCVNKAPPPSRRVVSARGRAACCPTATTTPITGTTIARGRIRGSKSSRRGKKAKAKLPGQSRFKFQMIVNLKTAKGVGPRGRGRCVPAGGRADEVIEEKMLFAAVHESVVAYFFFFFFTHGRSAMST